MANGIEELVSVLQIDPAEPSKTYRAEVSSIDNKGRVWVYLEGSAMETPTTMSSAEVEVGDNVNVEWRNNKLYIAGNVSNPSAGSIRVRAVEQATQIANQAAQSAVADAGIARTAAEQAQATADRVEGIAERAEGYAEDAQASADSARQSAGTALDQLGIIENVVGVLELVAKNGEYRETQDTEVQEKKWYFTRSGTEPNYVYSVVPNPTGNPSDEGWYEITDISEAVQNYVSSQLVVDDNGLWLKRPESTGIQSKVLLSSTDGVVLYGTDGKVVGKYGATAQIGDADGFHIEMSGTELGFYQGTRKVAYISNNQLYITQSVVLRQMDLGTPVNDGGLGQWSWKIHPNGQNPSRNNLNLKWIG